MIRLADFQILKKDLVQFIVVILSRVDEHMACVPVQLGNHTAHLDEFGPRAHDGHDFKHEVLL
jgi:hypothetical protein